MMRCAKSPGRTWGKRRVTMMLDPDIIERLKAGDRGWQTRANALLREALEL